MGQEASTAAIRHPRHRLRQADGNVARTASEVKDRSVLDVWKPGQEPFNERPVHVGKVGHGIGRGLGRIVHDFGFENA